MQIVLILVLGLATHITCTCINNTECGNGMCTQSACVCTLGYISSGTNQTCNYKQKEKLTAFLLSFLVGSTGADWFYLAQGNGGSI